MLLLPANPQKMSLLLRRPYGHTHWSKDIRHSHQFLRKKEEEGAERTGCEHKHVFGQAGHCQLRSICRLKHRTPVSK